MSRIQIGDLFSVSVRIWRIHTNIIHRSWLNFSQLGFSSCHILLTNIRQWNCFSHDNTTHWICFDFFFSVFALLDFIVLLLLCAHYFCNRFFLFFRWIFEFVGWILNFPSIFSSIRSVFIFILILFVLIFYIEKRVFNFCGRCFYVCVSWRSRHCSSTLQTILLRQCQYFNIEAIMCTY